MTDPDTDPAATFKLWLDASDGSIASHDGVRWPDGTATIHHRYHRGLTATHSSPEAACQSVYGKQGRIVWDNARTTPGNPATSGDEADNSARATVTITVHAPDQANADRWATTIRDLVTAEHGHHMRLSITVGGGETAGDDGLRDLYAAAIRAKIDGTEGCANGYRLADAVLAVRDRRLLELAAEADADSKQLAEVDERCDRYAAAIARVRALAADMHGITGARTWATWLDNALDAPADPTPPDPLAALHTWLTTNAAHHRAAAPRCRIPEGAQAQDGMGAGLEIAARVVAGLIAGRGLPVSGGVKPEAAGE